MSSCSSMSNKKGVSRLGGGGKTQAEVKLVQKSSRHSEEAGRDEGEQNLASGEGDFDVSLVPQVKSFSHFYFFYYS